LGRLCFEDRANLKKLNAIMQKPIMKQFVMELFDKLVLKRNKVVFMDVPLLFESKLNYICDHIVVVSVNEEVQLARLMARDADRGVSLDDAKARIKAQMPLSKKCQMADKVLENNGSLEEFQAKCRDWMAKEGPAKSDRNPYVPSRISVVASTLILAAGWILKRFM